MRHAVLAAALLSALTVVARAQPAPGTAPSIAVTDAWARPSPGASTTGAAYFTITDGAGADRLIGLSTPVAGSADLHETINDNGVMKMRGVPGLALEPGKAVTLSPGGYHVMLMGLKHPLKAGESFPLTLTFEKAPPLTVQVAVGMPGAAGSAPHMPNMPGMEHMPGGKP